MKLFVIVVASLLVLPVSPRAEPRGQGSAGPQTRVPQAPPPGWSETKRKARDLALEGKDLEVVALFEQWVAAHPDFGEGHFRLGGAHESVARTLVVDRAPAQKAAGTTHFEARPSTCAEACSSPAPTRRSS
jgi:hypothetical protein